MGVKVYISGISGNKEVKKRQQRVLMILESRNVKYDVIDIAEPDNEEHKDFMQNNATSLGGTVSDPKPRHALPPQIFNDDIYCGDYDQFDLANENDEMDKFLKLAPANNSVISNADITLGNGDVIESTKPEVNGENIESDAGDAVVESTTKDDDVPAENGTHKENHNKETTNAAENSEDKTENVDHPENVVDSSSAGDFEATTDD